MSVRRPMWTVSSFRSLMRPQIVVLPSPLMRRAVGTVTLRGSRTPSTAGALMGMSAIEDIGLLHHRSKKPGERLRTSTGVGDSQSRLRC
jgi:hypothetical protein